MENNFKVLTHCGVYIDTNLLSKGLYMTTKPNLYDKNETIEAMIERALWMKDISGVAFITDSYLDNLRQCKLTDVLLEIKE